MVEDQNSGVLYKYRDFSARSLELLIRRELYFAAVNQLNDPHDCRLSIRDALREAIETAYRLDNADLRFLLERLQGLDHVYEKMEHDIERVGVFSLSTNPLNVVMWSHYASNHSGFCIGFSLSEETTSPENDMIGISPVEYESANPYTEFFYKVAKAEDHPEWAEFWMELLSIGMTAKGEAWTYEDELRVIRKESGFAEFNPSELIEIVFGLNMANRERDTIRKLLEGREWEHVKFREVARSVGFGLVLRDIE